MQGSGVLPFVHRTEDGEPEQELLFQVLLAHLETFLAQARSEVFSLPRHVENELRAFLKCGVLANVAAITDAASIKTYLDGVGHSSRIPKPHPARPPPRTEMEYEEVSYQDGV